MPRSRTMCVIYTETNGLHHTNDDIYKKNLYNFARLVALNYEIGYTEDDKFISTKKVRSIIRPRCMHISEESIKIHNITTEIANKEGLEIEKVLDTFAKDMVDVTVIVSHNVDFHLKTIIAEFVRYNRPFAFDKFIIIDTISFYHKLSYPKLQVLYDTVIIKKKKKTLSTLDMIRMCFLQLYSDYEKSITS